MSLYSFTPPLSLLHPPPNFILAVFCLWASCRLSSRLPSSFLELPSSIALSSLQAYLQLPSGLIWISFGSLWGSLEPCYRIILSLLQTSFKLAFCFLQAAFKLPASFLEFPLQFLASCFKHASSLLHAPSKLPLSFFGACFELALGILPIEKLKTLKPLFFALHTQASKAQSHKTLVSCVACKTFRTSKP